MSRKKGLRLICLMFVFALALILPGSVLAIEQQIVQETSTSYCIYTYCDGQLEACDCAGGGGHRAF